MIFSELPATVSSLLPIELRASALEDEPFDNLVGRLYAFIKWARKQDPTIVANLDIDAAFMAIFGYSFEDLTAAGLITRHYFRSISSVPQLKLLNPIVDVEFLVAPLTVQAPIRDFLISYSTPIADLAKLLQPRDRMSAAALLPLQERPFVALGNGLYACPSLTFLSASLGIGLFHRLSRYYASKNRRHTFYHFFGRFLQDYLHHTVSISVDKRSAQAVPEFKYRVGKQQKDSSDLILIDGRTAVFFDVCNKRLNTELSLNVADLKTMQDDIDAMILSQAKQLNGRVNDFPPAITLLGV